jgi:hypothetical protein
MNLIKIPYPGFSIQDVLNGHKTADQEKDQNILVYLYDQYELLILMGLAMIIMFIFSMLLMIHRKVRAKVIEIIFKAKDNILFNGIIRSI